MSHVGTGGRVVGPLSGRVVDSHVSALKVDPVELFDAHGGLLGRGHLDEPETTRTASLRAGQRKA